MNVSSALHTPKSSSAVALSFPGPSPSPSPAFSVTTQACVLWKRPNFATQDVSPSSTCIEERFVFISFNYASVYVRVSARGSQRQQLPWNWSHRQL